MARSVQVLLTAADPANQRRWTKWLSGLADVQLLSSDGGEGEPSVQVIVTDRTPLGDQLPAWRSRLAAGEIGLIAVGTTGPADVALPPDATRRELELACRLLAEIVRLRRARRAGRRQQDQLRLLAMTDALTGLPNRRGWEEQLAARCGDCQGRDASFCLALFDLDHFKHINDQHGHVCGDAVLRTVARALAEGVRDCDVVARLGGDEFALLLSVADADAASRIVERVRQSVERALSEAQLPTVTASAGFCLGPGRAGPTNATLLETADSALRQAKSEGRNRAVFGDVAARPGSTDK